MFSTNCWTLRIVRHGLRLMIFDMDFKLQVISNKKNLRRKSKLMRATFCIRNNLRMGPVLDTDYQRSKRQVEKAVLEWKVYRVYTRPNVDKNASKKHHLLIKWDGPFVKSVAIKAIEGMVDEMVKSNDFVNNSYLSQSRHTPACSRNRTISRMGSRHTGTVCALWRNH